MRNLKLDASDSADLLKNEIILLSLRNVGLRGQDFSSETVQELILGLNTREVHRK